MENEYCIEVWSNIFRFEYEIWTGWNFSQLMIFKAEDAAKALENANNYIKKKSNQHFKLQIRDIKKI